jgi:hypothetical protein
MVVSSDGAVVALGESLDDGQPESGPAGGARGVGAGESVEGVGQEGGVKARPVVADADLDAVAGGTLGVDSDWRGAVLGGVVDEVADDPIEIGGVGADVLARWAVDGELVAEAVAVAVGDRLQVRAYVDGWRLGGSAGVRDGE